MCMSVCGFYCVCMLCVVCMRCLVRLLRYVCAYALDVCMYECFAYMYVFCMCSYVCVMYVCRLRNFCMYVCRL